jgi:hypothetical protein
MKIRNLIFIISFALPVFAETGLFTVGIKGGIGLAGFWGKDAADTTGMTTTMRSGLSAGAMLALNFSEFFAGQLEFLYSMKGKSAIGDYASYSKGITIRTDYFEIPVLFRFSYPVGEISRLILCAGPTFSFCISSKEDSTVEYEPSQIIRIDTTVDLKSRTNPFDVGMTVGGGMAVKGGPGEVLFEVRYTLGLLDKYELTDEEKRANTPQPDVKNSYITFLIGYSITL